MKKFLQAALLWAAALSAVMGFSMAHAADFPGNKVLFESGKADVPAASAADIKAVADFLAGNAGAKVQISGYVDVTGPADANKALAKQRAFAVRDMLKAAGVAEDRIVLQKPEDLTAGSGEQGRKVEMTLASSVTTAATAAAAPAVAVAAPAAAASAAPAPVPNKSSSRPFSKRRTSP